jgi:hypothetical protein
MKMTIESNCLKAEAESIIRDLHLLELLRPHGEARIVGSVALDLVIKPDIDIHLLTETADLMSVADAVYHSLLAKAEVKYVRLSDYRHRGGLKVGIDSYPGRLADWSIDLWVTNDHETTGFALVDRLMRRLPEERRRAILEIKHALHAEGRLKDGMSARIYAAVVDRGVRSVTGFENHVK